MADGTRIDQEAFSRRLKRFYDAWKEGGDTWAGATAIAVPVGTASDDLRYLKSVSLQLWLYGYELPDTVMLFTKSELHVLTSGKKAGLLSALAESAQRVAGIRLVLHTRPKAEDGRAQAEQMLAAARASASSPSLGTLPKDKAEGKVAAVWAEVVAASGLATIDVASGLATVLAVKEEPEIMNVKKAAFLASTALKAFTIPQVEGIIDEEKKVKHAKLAEQIEEVITDPSKINIKLRAENVDIAYPPIVQSGGVYDLRVSAASDERPLAYDVIVVSLGARYSMYCANVARTLLVDPSKTQEAQYKALADAQAAAIAALVPGAPISAAYSAATTSLQEAGQGQLAERLGKNIGFGMGLEFRESSHLISPKNSATVQAGMVFNVAVGCGDLERTDGEAGKAVRYALLLADTVVVRAGAAPEVLTSAAPKSWVDCAYYFKDEEEEAAGAANGAAARPQYDASEVVRKSALRSEDEVFRAQEEARRKQKENQEDLLKKLNEETLRNLTAAPSEAGGPQAGRQVSEVVAYRTVADVPAARELAIQVDQRNEAVLVPIYGVMVPFHILTVKNATSNQDGDHAYIRLNFNFGPAFEPGSRFPGAIFLKELSFRSADSRHAVKVVQEIKVLRSAVTAKERERAERATLVEQERLQKSKGRVYALPDVWIRPAFGGKGRKMTGQLEAHANGFRYSSPKGEVLDIMYRNIKHAFFQPAENEMITLVHFHLRNPIMVGKKKTLDVQFYTEVMESVQTLDAGRRSHYDPDEIEEEQREREMRNRVNKQFQQFVKRVQQDVWERDFPTLNLEFEIPFRELGFMGVPHRSTAFVMPTVNCLVELIEVPFLVITLNEVQLVSLERVGFGLKAFDMAIVFKELTRDVARIDAIPQQSLDTIRDWLTSMSIKYYENKMNLNWKPILKKIMEDPEGFVDDGGWSFLDVDKSDSDEEGAESEGDDEFQPSGSDDEEEEEESDNDSENESLVSEDSEDEEEEEDEDEEEGKSWEELEREALREDRKKAAYDDASDDDLAGKRKKKGGGSGGPPKRARR